MATRIQVVIDCADPAKLSRFWAGALDYVIPGPPEGFGSWPEFLQSLGVPESDWNNASAAEDPSGDGPRLFFQKVPEAKTVKNRVHIDVNAGGPRGTPEDERARRVAEKVEQLVAAGATKVEERAQLGDRWVVMLDPEGNEFCVQ